MFNFIQLTTYKAYLSTSDYTINKVYNKYTLNSRMEIINIYY